MQTIQLAAIELPELNHEILRASWKQIAAKKQNSAQATAYYITLWAMLRAENSLTQKLPLPTLEALVEPTLKRLLRAFTPITNKRKLANGQMRYGAIVGALSPYSYTRVRPEQEYLEGVVLSGEAIYNLKNLHALILQRLLLEASNG